MPKTYNRVELLILLPNKKTKNERKTIIKDIWGDLSLNQKEKLGFN